MWYIFLTLLTLESHSLTPTSPSEDVSSQWSNAMEAVALRKTEESVFLLKAFIEKNHSDSRILDAQFYLGQSLVQLDKYEEALPYLKTFIETAGIKLERKEARLLLIKSYLGAEKYSEAKLSVEDFQQSLKEPNESDLARIYLYRAEAESGLKKGNDAEKNLTLFFAKANELPDLGEEITRASFIKIQIKALECDSYPSQKNLPEDQLLDQMKKKSICLLEISTLLNTMGKNPDPKRLDLGFYIYKKSLQSFFQTALDPSLLLTGKQTKDSLKKSKVEFTLKLLDEWKNLLKNIKEILLVRETLKMKTEELFNFLNTLKEEPKPSEMKKT